MKEIVTGRCLREATAGIDVPRMLRIAGGARRSLAACQLPWIVLPICPIQLLTCDAPLLHDRCQQMPLESALTNAP
jgi:hypothetical protein